jgi:Putative Actinobacterial Holin-X, holin superfamily III
MSDQTPSPGSGAYKAPAADRGPATTSDLQDKPLPELLKQLSDQTASLVRKEMELANAEMTVKGKQAGIGVGAFGGAGLFGLFAFAALTACFILALDLRSPVGWRR